MSCRGVRRRLSPWIDGELSARASASVEAHLEACAPCRKVADELRALVGAAAALPAEDAPDDLFARVLAAHDEAGASGRQPSGWRWAPVAALAAAGLVAVVWVGAGGPDRGVAVPPPVDGGRAAAVVVKRSPRDADLLASARREFARAETHYQRAIGQLRRIALEDSSGWARRRRSFYLRDLALIEDAVARHRHAARIAPTDPVAQEMLFSAYRRQIRLMQGAILDESLGRDEPTFGGARVIPAGAGVLR